MAGELDSSRADNSMAKATVMLFKEAEELAEEILRDKHDMVELDKRRQINREALNAIKREQSEKKSWACFGNVFLRLPTQSVQDLINKDQNVINDELNDKRHDLKKKVEDLQKLEGGDVSKGFQLNPMTKDEMKGLKTS